MNLTNHFKNMNDDEKSSFIQKCILGFIFLTIVWFVASSVYSTIHQYMIKTMVVESETTDIVYDEFGFLAPTESLLKLDVSGDVSQNIDQNQRVAKNQSIFTVSYKSDDGKETKKKHYYAPISGVVSYQIDGYEDVNDINDIQKLNFRDIYEKGLSQSDNSSSGKIYAKVVDNLKSIDMYMAYDPKSNKLFSDIGDSFRIRFKDLNEETVGTVEEIIDGNEGQKFCRVSLGPVSDDLLTKRVVQVEIYRSENANLVFSKNVLVYQDDQAGVYTVNNRVVQWTPVTVLAENNNRVTCEILPKGTKIVLTPKMVSSGDYVKG